MIKTKSWSARALYILIALALIISLAIVAAPTKTSASSGTPGSTTGADAKWVKASTPSGEGLVITQGSNILDIAIGDDGETMYAILNCTQNVTIDSDNYTVGQSVLVKSTDGGETWKDDITKNLHEDEDITEPFDNFYLVDVALDNAAVVVVANATYVAVSGDGGKSWDGAELGTGCPGNITSLDVSKGVDETYSIIVGTDAGNVCINDCGIPCGLGSWKCATDEEEGWLDSTTAVTSVAFSPNFDYDDTILAVTTDDDATYLQVGRWGTSKIWNEGPQYPLMIVAAPPLTTDECSLLAYNGTATGIALPSDFDGLEYDDPGVHKLWVYVDYNTTDIDTPANTLVGRVFEITNKATYAGLECQRTDASPLIASMDMYGTIEDGKIMVGVLGDCDTGTECCKGIQVYRTAAWPIDTCCPQWDPASKLPTGQSRAIVAYGPDGNVGYAATGGLRESCDESAFSVSNVGEVGQYWNQMSLIDTSIDYFSDVAVNPECGTIYLFSVNLECGCGCDSVWRSIDNGDNYLRVWNGELANTDCNGNTPQIGLIRLAPEETAEVLSVYLVDRGTDTIYYNDYSGLTKWNTRHATVDYISDLAVQSASTVYAVDCTTGKVAKSTDYGKRFAKTVDSGIDGLGHTIAVSGTGDNAVVLVGGQDSSKGKVAFSTDAGATFSVTKAMPTAATGKVHVAFDVNFATNNIIYASVSGAGIYRGKADTTTAWEDLVAKPTPCELGINETVNSTLDLKYYGIATGKSDGTLYATYSWSPENPVDDGAVANYTGVARCLSPWTEIAPCCGPEMGWDYLHQNLQANSTFTLEPSSLKICGCLSADSTTILWAIDQRTYNYKASVGCLWYYEDCSSKVEVTLNAPADGYVVAKDPCNCTNAEFILSWDELCDFCGYDIQIAKDAQFSDVVLSTSDFATGPSKTWEAACVNYYKPSDAHNPSLVVRAGTLSCGEQYYWRVRGHAAGTGEKIASRWSEPRSFTVESAIALTLTAPAGGASDVKITNATVGFTWTTIPDATYDFSLKDGSGAVIANVTGLTSGSYSVSGSSLKYNTSYFWTVQAKDANGNVIKTAGPSTFTTESEPAGPVQPAPTPTWVWVVIGIGAVLVIVTLVLIFRTRRV